MQCPSHFVQNVQSINYRRREDKGLRFGTCAESTVHIWGRVTFVMTTCISQTCLALLEVATTHVQLTCSWGSLSISHLYFLHNLPRVCREVVLGNGLRVLLVSDTSDEPLQGEDDGEVDSDKDEDISDDCSIVTDCESDVSPSSDNDSDCDRDGLRSTVRRQHGAHEVTHMHTHTCIHTH